VRGEARIRGSPTSKIVTGRKSGGKTPYDLKKTALRTLRQAGVSEERAMIFSGHKTASTFRDLRDNGRHRSARGPSGARRFPRGEDAGGPGQMRSKRPP